jgi:hypothetical protein
MSKVSKTVSVVTVANGGCLRTGIVYYNILSFDASYVRSSVENAIHSYYGEEASVQSFDSQFSVEQTRERLMEEYEQTFTVVNKDIKGEKKALVEGSSTLVRLGTNDVVKCVKRACGMEVKTREAKPAKAESENESSSEEEEEAKPEPKKEVKKEAKPEPKKEVKKEAKPEPKKEEKKQKKDEKKEVKKDKQLAVSDSEDD